MLWSSRIESPYYTSGKMYRVGLVSIDITTPAKVQPSYFPNGNFAPRQITHAKHLDHSTFPPP